MISVNNSYNFNIELLSFGRHEKHIEYRHLHPVEAPWLELESIFKYDLFDFLNERELQRKNRLARPLVELLKIWLKMVRLGNDISLTADAKFGWALSLGSGLSLVPRPETANDVRKILYLFGTICACTVSQRGLPARTYPRPVPPVRCRWGPEQILEFERSAVSTVKKNST